MSRPARPLDPSAADRLCTAAAAVFGARGLDGASLNGILNQTGMGKGSFYHRFADKAALHDWVTERLSAAALAEVRPPHPDGLTAELFREELSAVLARLAQMALARPELMDLGRMFHNSVDAPPERAIAKMRQAVIAWIAGVLEAGQGLGTIRTDLPRSLLTGWAIASLATIDQWVLTSADDAETRGRTAAAALGIFWELITGRNDAV